MVRRVLSTGTRLQDLTSCAMVQLVTSRLASLSTAADWDLAECLHGEVKEVYIDPSFLRVPGEPNLPKGKVCGSKRDLAKFALRAEAAKGAEFFRDDELEKDVDGDVIVAGFLALWKLQLQDPTITARLAQNR